MCVHVNLGNNCVCLSVFQCMVVCFLLTDGVIENLEALVFCSDASCGMCLLETGYNEVSVVTFQAVVASNTAH